MYDDSAMRDLRAAFEDEVLRWPLVAHKTMFGSPCYLAADRMFAFLVSGGLVISCTDEAMRTRLKSQFGARPFVSGGKTIGGWMRVDMEEEAALGRIMPVVAESYEKALCKK